MFEALPFILSLDDPGLGLVHRAFDRALVLVGREPGEAFFCRQFDIDRDPVCIEPGLMDQLRIGLRNGLQVDVAAKIVLFAQDPGHLRQLLHRVV